MADKEFLGQVKRITKRVPVVQGINRIRLNIIRIRELSNLIDDNRIVIFHLNSTMGYDVPITREMVREMMKEWLDLYGIVHLRRTTRATINSPESTIMLYVPLAMLRIPCSYEEYLRGVRHETRKAIHLAERQGYEFKEFIWNDHLDEIYEINTSKEIRQSIPMIGWYREPVQPRNHTNEELKYLKYYGGFKDGILCAYFHLWICGEFALVKHIMGHALHLKYGIMNGLISYAVRECTNNSQIQWLKYGTYEKGSLCSFKRHAGFQEYAALLELEGDNELLKYSEQKVRTIWHL